MFRGTYAKWNCHNTINDDIIIIIIIIIINVMYNNTNNNFALVPFLEIFFGYLRLPWQPLKSTWTYVSALYDTGVMWTHDPLYPSGSFQFTMHCTTITQLYKEYIWY